VGWLSNLHEERDTTNQRGGIVVLRRKYFQYTSVVIEGPAYSLKLRVHLHIDEKILSCLAMQLTGPCFSVHSFSRVSTAVLSSVISAPSSRDFLKTSLTLTLVGFIENLEVCHEDIFGSSWTWSTSF
jgi:hypothetical protein